jgi:hypothetical protein
MIVDRCKALRPQIWFQLALIAGLLSSTIVRAEDLTGLWATDARNCDKIFIRTGQGFALAKDADLYGSGFIIEGRRIVTQLARCEIKTAKEDGATTHLIAACATDVMLSNVQASFRMINKDRIVRMFPAVTDMEIPFERCVLK